MFLQNVTEVTTIPEALLNTVIGMGTTFAVLILISFIIYLLRFVPKLLAGNKNGKEKKEEAVQAVEPSPASVVQTTPAANPDTQLVAVITAAVAAYMTEESGVPVSADGLVIRSIKKRTFS